MEPLSFSIQTHLFRICSVRLCFVCFLRFLQCIALKSDGPMERYTNNSSACLKIIFVCSSMGAQEQRVLFVEFLFRKRCFNERRACSIGGKFRRIPAKKMWTIVNETNDKEPRCVGLWVLFGYEQCARFSFLSRPSFHFVAFFFCIFFPYYVKFLFLFGLNSCAKNKSHTKRIIRQQPIFGTRSLKRHSCFALLK